ncbi:hypothetical protein ACIFOT_04675 [Neobacillus sp. NRS-1170]|uniref:hypothetical protein n=1 Tax=Neobacillus sp. NRS-1170 TaxID=3233898 RepID=UPI003D2D8BAD
MNLVNYFKQLEEKLNGKIKCLFNRHKNFIYVKKMIWLDLKRVRIQRIIAKNWLNSKGYVTKEEISNIAKKYISIEEKVDDLDDLVFSMTKNWNSNKQSLTSMHEILNKLKSLMEEEYRE